MLRLNHIVRQPLVVVGLLFTFGLWLLPCICRAGEIVLSMVGRGQWQISATGLNNVLALDLDLRYAPQHLSGLSATVGEGLAGAMAAVNDKVPGVIRLGAIASQPLPQSGLLLKLQSSAPEAELVVAQFTVKAVDANGKIVPTTIRQQLPPGNFSRSPTETALSATTAVQMTTETPRQEGVESGGQTGDTFPPDPSAESLPTPASSPGAEAAPAPGSAATEPVSTRPETHFHAQEDIVAAIERLPQPWTVSAIQTIIHKIATESQIRQEPPVAIADGKSRIQLYLPKVLSQKQPAIGVQGCTVGTIRDVGDQGWQIELVTIKDHWPATAFLLGESALLQFQIMVVPALANIAPPESDNAVIPTADFDGDGVFTAIDAYLYVGNLLGRSANSTPGPTAR